MEIVRVLIAAPTAPGEARRSLRSLRGLVTPGQLDDLRLVVSELVTNSLLHSGLEREAVITLKVSVSHAMVRVEVLDAGRGFANGTGPSREEHGWGLGIVDRLADDWGTVRNDETLVWAEFSLRA